MAAGAQTDTPVRAGRVSSEILDRLPPHHLEAERGVLGSILLDPQMCDEVIPILRVEDFYSEAHRRLYRTLLEMRDNGQQIDVMLLTDRLRKNGDLEAVGGAQYIAEILQSVPVAAHAVYYANLVRDKATLRELIHA
ncbi:MAG TPA: DnaB-like helicase N-terminal domain-containing protein, partial [Thermoguttaceae bacterium]|nr:DnaB-like helicase N-terminal domain-containing protein [Thermoguttaceae bacterium]